MFYLVNGKRVIVFNANDALYLYIKNESKRLGLTLTGFMNYMLSKVLTKIPKEELVNCDVIPVKTWVIKKYGSSGSHSMYLSVNHDVYMKLETIYKSGPGRESMSKCIRSLIVKYIELKKEGVF